jgi:hypothetical protein
MVNETWLDKLNKGRDNIDFVIKKLNNLSQHFEAVGNDKISKDLADLADLEFGLDDINHAIDNHLTTGAKEAWANTGRILSKMVDVTTKEN